MSLIKRGAFAIVLEAEPGHFGPVARQLHLLPGQQAELISRDDPRLSHTVRPGLFP